VEQYAANTAIKLWKRSCRQATLRGGATRILADPPSVSHVRDILDRYRPRLVELGRLVGTMQADALSKLSFLNYLGVCDICKMLDLWVSFDIGDGCL
jgi:hypothetical protein